MCFTHLVGILLSLVASGAVAAVPALSTTIDTRIAERWTEADVQPSKPATDAAWCRRVYLDVLGRIPTVEELRKFTGDRKPQKRERLVARLLGAEYLEEYAVNWTTIWTNLLVGRTGGTNNNSLVSRPGLQQYLRRAYQKNKPLDVLMTELVTATGSCRPGDDDFNGAANFLADKLAENGIQATAKTAQIFLGTAVQCTQCHNHPFNEHQQNQFWELNAFFRQARIEPLAMEAGNNRRVARILNRDFSGEGGDPTKAEIYYELRNGKLKVGYPVFIDGTSLVSLYADRGEDFGDSGYVGDINRRQELAKMIRASDEFPRAMVNRLWGHFFGYGFTKPVDDIGPHNPPSHPELLEELAQNLRDTSFDGRELVRAILLTETYALSSEPNRSNLSDDPAMGAKPLFSRFYVRQMQAEQLYESLLAATQAQETLAYDEQERTKQQWLAQFNMAFGNDENGEATSFNGSIPQVLMMMNGDLVKRATSADPGSFLAKVADSPKLSNSDKIEYLYAAALARPPARNELAVCNQILAAHKGHVGAALQDVWWALLNSNEFILNH
jgi:hypothetical protein